MFLSNLAININSNQISFSGSFQLEEVLGLVYQWFRALPEGQDQARLDAIAASLKAHNDGLNTVITAHLGTTSTAPKE